MRRLLLFWRAFTRSFGQGLGWVTGIAAALYLMKWLGYLPFNGSGQ